MSTATPSGSARTDLPIFRLWEYAQPHRRTIFLATLCSILNKLFDLAPPLLIGGAVDIVVEQENSLLARLGVVDVGDQLLLLSAVTLFAFAMESIFEYVYKLIWRNLAQTLQHDLRLSAYANVQQLELAYYEERSSGRLMAILNDDINQLERFLDIGANEIIQLLTTITVVGTMFLVLAPSVSWMAVLPMPFIVWGSIRFQKYLAPRYAAVREQVGVLNGFLANNIGGIATIKSFTAEAHEEQRIARESNTYRERNRAAIKLSAAFVPLIRILILIGFVAIMYFGGQLVLDNGLAVGVYSVLVFMSQRLLWPLTRLGDTLDQYQRAMASTARVLDLLDTRPQITDGPTQLPVTGVVGELSFEQVSFTYPSMPDVEGQVIRDLTLRIPAGKTTAIVGSTGSGKTTLVKLLLRFYDVQSGRITLDGIPLESLRLADLRMAIGYVSQDVFLFHGTVRENICYGTFDATDEAIVRAAKISAAHDFILALPNGYDTIVGERGQKLSGGQRQRISIARALLKNPPVLILDEATSSVDNETEAAIQMALEYISRDRTTIVIAHRLSTVRNADCIYVLDNGILTESGKHEALLAQDGIYNRLWRVQTGALREALDY